MRRVKSEAGARDKEQPKDHRLLSYKIKRQKVINRELTKIRTQNNEISSK